MSAFKEAALRYHAQGLHPFPVEVAGKRPILDSWREYVTRQPTVEEIEAWWTATPDANIALAQGRGVFVLDIDGPEGHAALAEAGVALPDDTPMVSTGKGVHYYLAAPPGVAVKNGVGLLAKVDIRSDGGYVVAPPSIHPSGRRYEWVVPLGAEEFKPAPARLMELLANPRGPATAAPKAEEDWLAVALQGVGEGMRDTTCTRIAGALLAKGISADAAEAILLAWADRCTPPFAPSDVEKCVRSIAAREGEHEQMRPPSPLGPLLDGAMAGLIAGKSRARATNIGSLDKVLGGGFFPGQLIYLGARPGVGKTTLALQVAREAALAGSRVLIVSGELTANQVAEWLLVQESGVKFSNVRERRLEQVELAMLSDAATRLRVLQITVADDVETVEELREVLAQPYDMAIVDYLQYLRTAQKWAGARERVEEVSRELKSIAKKTLTPILCLSSLSRPDAQNKNWRPSMASLRESGQLEHDGDTVLLLHREPDGVDAELIVGKQREGPAGMTLNLRFCGELLTFTEQEKS